MIDLFYSFTRQLGMVVHQFPYHERALAFMNQAIAAILEAQAEEHSEVLQDHQHGVVVEFCTH
jgi:hypothetical protein